MKKLLQFGPLFVIIAALLWSFDGILRISLYSLPPSVVVFYEHLLGFLVLLIFSLRWLKDLKNMTKKEWLAVIIIALFSGALGTIFYTAALQKINYTQYSVVVLLQQQLQPIWAISTAAILLKEKLSKNFLAWAALALFAAYFITFKDLRVNLSTGAETILAGLLSLAAGFMWGTSTAVSKFVLKKVSFLTGTALRFFFAPLFALIFIVGQNQTSSLFSLNNSQWITLLVITLSTGMIAVIFYYYGLKKTPARITTICELVWPASAIFIDYFLFHKTLSLTQILGITLLILAIYKITKPLKNKLGVSAEEFSRS
ncbi:MAG: DMT family transporter [Candidatus Levybacteria bacterium]|nr:DMT family transporter [Candidatus Levybacteria bacterium]